jgi:acetate kinase
VKILVLNAGSSSVKYQVIDTDSGVSLSKGAREDIGRGGASSIDQALSSILESLDTDLALDAVGHRVVHGGALYRDAAIITPEVVADIEVLSAIAPLHNPANIAGIRAAQKALPDVPHVAVFDTAFHQTMLEEAFTYAIPRELAAEHGLRKYGFHGSSHSFVSRSASALLGGDPKNHRIITLHLGNGSSIAAIRGGQCLDTSMGFTPLPGLVMGTRSGDVDPAIITYLLRNAGLTLDEVDSLLNSGSGLLGLAGTSDFREVLSAADSRNSDALLALRVWSWRIRHYIGAYAALLGGLDALVFTGGIGENSAEARLLCVEGLGFMGIEIDEYLNGRGASAARTISPAGGGVAVMVIPTNEELEIALQSAEVLGGAR